MQRSSCGMASSHIYTAVFILLPPHPTRSLLFLPLPWCCLFPYACCCTATVRFIKASCCDHTVMADAQSLRLSQDGCLTPTVWLTLRLPPSALLLSLSAFSFLFLVSTGLHELIGPSSWSQQFSFPVPMKPTTVRFIWTVADQRSARYVSNSVPY